MADKDKVVIKVMTMATTIIEVARPAPAWPTIHPILSCHQSTTCTPTLPPIQHRINQEQHERSQDRRNNTQAPITSGEFYKDRRDILHRLNIISSRSGSTF